MRTTTSNVRKDSSFLLKTVAGKELFHNGRGRYSIGKTPNTTIRVCVRHGSTSEENLRWIKERAEKSVGVECQWVDGPTIEYIAL